MDWQLAPDIKFRLNRLLAANLFPYIRKEQIIAMRGIGSTSRATARIWSFPKPWQLALNLGPRYIIEVLANRFDKLTETEKDKVLIHELMHIPKTASGALLAHRHHSRNINPQTVELIYKKYYEAAVSRG